jgi:hypothetical protein
VKEIQLTQGQVALIDDEDFELIRPYKWNAQYNKNTDSYYAVANIPNQNGRTKSYVDVIRMHTLIANTPNGLKTDHKNHNTLDNRKENLRICNDSESAYNRKMRSDNQTGFKGITFEKKKKLFRAVISANGKRIGLGRYKTAELASAAYEKAAKELHGEFYYKDSLQQV